MRAIVIVFYALVVAGCASAPLPVAARTSVERRVGENPQIGVAAERSVGEVIYEIYNYEVRRETSTHLLDSLTIDVFLASAQLSPGDKLVATTYEGTAVHCSVESVLRVGGQANSSHLCLRDQNSDGQFDLWRSPDGPPARRKWANLKHHVSFREETSVGMGESGFRYELLYQGLSAGVVSILYREYLESLIRPAFQQDLSYTLNPAGETEISFRGIRMTVASADNNAIRYTVNRGLNPQS